MAAPARTSRLSAACWALTSLLAACATAPTPPPPKSVNLAGARAAYRDYREVPEGLCYAEPRWLAEELEGVNAVLRSFLEKTTPPARGEWPPETLELLQEGARTLPAVVAAHRSNLAGVDSCGFGSWRTLPKLVEQGHALLAAVEPRLEQTPALLAHLEGRSRYEAWQQDHRRERQQAEASCEGRRGSRAQVPYFAWEDEEGRTRWLFCSGAEVVRAPDEEARWSAPPDATARERRRLKPQRDLRAAAAFPSDSIRRPPQVPPMPDLGTSPTPASATAR